MIGPRVWPFWTLIAILVLLFFGAHLALGLGWEVPDVLTVAVLLAARRLSAPAAAAFGLAAGILRDSLSLVAFGADAVALTLVAFAGSRSRDLFVGESLQFVGVYLFVGKWLHDVVYYLLAGPQLRGEPVIRFLVLSPLAALYAAATGVAILFIYRLVSGER